MFCAGGAKHEPLKCSQTKEVKEELLRRIGGGGRVREEMEVECHSFSYSEFGRGKRPGLRYHRFI